MILQTRKLVPPRSTARYTPYTPIISNNRLVGHVLADLFCPIRYGSDICGYLAQCSPLPFQTFLHLPYELFDSLVDFLGRIVELRRHPLDLSVKRHICGRAGVGQFGVEDRLGPAHNAGFQLIVVSFLTAHTVTKRI